MGYRSNCKLDCSPDIKVLPNSCQAFSSVTPKTQLTKEFGERLRLAFDGAKNNVIAEKLGVSDASVSAYMKGESFPNLENLKRISELTKYSLHWLLTGEGEADLDPFQFLGNNQRRIIEKLAADRGLGLEEMLTLLIQEALGHRGAALLLRYPELEVEDVEELRALVTLFEEEPGSSASSEASRKRG